MRIIGGHDYYDSALAFGHDDTVVLVRGDEVLSTKDAQNLGLYPRRLDIPYTRLNLWQGLTVIIGEVMHSGIAYDEGYMHETKFAWSQEGFEKLLAEAGEEMAERFTPEGRRKWIARQNKYASRWNRDITDDGRADYFDPVAVKPEVRAYMIENRISIMVQGKPVCHEGWLLNPDCLKQIAFGKRLDPYTLFQELDMWVSGVLGMSANPMIEVSNDVKIAKHGFDQFSFRKPKQKA